MALDPAFLVEHSHMEGDVHVIDKVKLLEVSLMQDEVQDAIDKPKLTCWFADVDGCFSCGGIHRGIKVEIDHTSGDWFICPERSAQVRASDPGNKSVSIADAARVLPSSRPVFRSDREANTPLSDGDDARPTDGALLDDDEHDGFGGENNLDPSSDEDPLSPKDFIEALSTFSVDARREFYRVLHNEFGSSPTIDSISNPSGSSANARQVAGSHYGGTYIQHWDVVTLFGLGYFEGQITKYLFRWRKKNGVQDLQKAQHFLEKLIEVETAREQKTLVGDQIAVPMQGNQIDEMTEDDIKDASVYTTHLSPEDTKDVGTRGVDPVDPQEGAS